MGKFKIGDRVRCIDDSDTDCVKSGEEYEVVGVNDPYVKVLVNGEPRGMYARRFEPLPVAAEAQPAAPMKIEAGRYYKTRDGRKVGPMYVYSDGWSEKGDAYCRMWRLDGRRYYNNDPASDLIAEWHDTPSAPVAAQVDAIAEKYGPVVAGRTLVRTGQGYGYELARFGGYVWVDIGKTAPITIRADKIAA